MYHILTPCIYIFRMTLTENTISDPRLACAVNYPRQHSAVYQKFLFDARELGLQSFNNVMASSGTSIPVTSGAATYPADDSVLVRKLQCTSFELYGKCCKDSYFVSTSLLYHALQHSRAPETGRRSEVSQHRTFWSVHQSCTDSCDWD
jgi:hypothetical protein